MRLLILITAILFFAPPADVAAQNTCQTSSGCLQCSENSNGFAECTRENRDGWCECEVDANRLTRCLVSGGCTFLSGGGGGWKGGGGGGGGSCTIGPADWCPPECASCTRVYWL